MQIYFLKEIIFFGAKMVTKKPYPNYKSSRHSINIPPVDSSDNEQSSVPKESPKYEYFVTK